MLADHIAGNDDSRVKTVRFAYDPNDNDDALVPIAYVARNAEVFPKVLGLVDTVGRSTATELSRAAEIGVIG